MPKIRCVLVDDHTLFRQGVRRLLETESDFEVVGEAGMPATPLRRRASCVPMSF